MLIALSPQCIRSVIQRDQTLKHQRWTAEMAALRASGNGEGPQMDVLQDRMQRNMNRNFSASAVITKSSHKFQFEGRRVEVAIKETVESVSAFTNKEFIDVVHHHHYTVDRHQSLECNIRRYAMEWVELLERGRGRIVERNDALKLIETRCGAQELDDMLHSKGMSTTKQHVTEKNGRCVLDKCHRIVRESYGLSPC